MKRNWNLVAHRVFQIGVVLKGVDGLIEIGGGSLLLLTTRPAIQHFVALLTSHELAEDPHDLLANLLVRLSQHLSIQTQHFAGFYLLGHGAVKMGLVIGLLCGVRWSYPTALVFLFAFVLYQGYRLSYQTSTALALLTVFDLIIIALVWREWKFRFKKQEKGA